MIKRTLQELCLNITDGKHGDCENEENSGYYFISCKDIFDGQINYKNARQITKADYEETHKRTMLEVDDILLTNSGTIGRMAFVTDREATTKTTFQKSVAIIKPDKQKVLPRYLYYQLQNCVPQFINSSNGSAQKNLLLSTMRTFQIEIEENREKQEKIADTLSAYDDLIENNQKQIKLLEETAQRLYKEWFVDLRFPGHENTKIVDGVPEGWRKFPLEEIAPVVTGKKDANYGDKGGNYPFFTCSQETITAPGYSFDTSAVILAGNGDFNVKLYRGKFEAYQRTYVLAPFDHLNLFNLYFTVQDNMEALAKGASGSTIKFLTKGMLQKILVLTADKKILDKFNDYEENIQQKVEALKKQVEDLTEIRNRLLPKLMSGEVEV